MRRVLLGSTGYMVSKTSFGALPIQRISMEEAGRLLRRAYQAGVNFFDTAHYYTDSEEKIGRALSDVRDDIVLATKSHFCPKDQMRKNIDQSLRMMKTDRIDLFQIHQADRVYRPGDADGIYDLLLDAKAKGDILHIGVSVHSIEVAEACVESGLFETLQYPFSVLSNEREIRLVQRCAKKNIGFIAMKAMAGGLIRDRRATFAFLDRYPNVVPIYGVQRMEELEEWLALEENPPAWGEAARLAAEREREELSGAFCRGCGYCLPCPAQIPINNAARIRELMTRAPYRPYLTAAWREQMRRVESCTGCGHCRTRCPYGLNPPALLREQLAWYDAFCSRHSDELEK